MTATEQLTRALVSLAADGGRPPCGDFGGHELWMSEQPGDRLVAVALCGGCPLVEQCGAAADETGENFGVWGGRDMTGRGRSRRSRSKAS